MSEIDEGGEHGHVEMVVGEIRAGLVGEGDEERGFLCDDGSTHHSSGQRAQFKNLDDIPQ